MIIFSCIFHYHYQSTHTRLLSPHDYAIILKITNEIQNERKKTTTKKSVKRKPVKFENNFSVKGPVCDLYTKSTRTMNEYVHTRQRRRKKKKGTSSCQIFLIISSLKSSYSIYQTHFPSFFSLFCFALK